MSREPVITERPPSLPEHTICVKTACGNMYVSLSTDQECFETKFYLGKSGSCQQAMLEAIQGLLTIMRRQLTPIPRKLIVKALLGIHCPFSNNFVASCPTAIGKLLEKEWGIKEESE